MGKYYCEVKKMDVNIYDICQKCHDATEERHNGYFRGCLFLFDKEKNEPVIKGMTEEHMLSDVKDILDIYVDDNSLKHTNIVLSANVNDGVVSEIELHRNYEMEVEEKVLKMAAEWVKQSCIGYYKEETVRNFEYHIKEYLKNKL
jgi:hypothetical protein